MFCQYCGAKVGDDYSFCVSCGAKIPNVSFANANVTGTSGFKSNLSNSLKSKSFNVDTILSSSSNINIFIALICGGTIVADFLSYLLIGGVGYPFLNHWYYYLALVVIAVFAVLKIDLKIFIAGLGLLAIAEFINIIKALNYNLFNLFLNLVLFGAVMFAIFLAVVNVFDVLGEEKEKVNKCYFISAALALFVLLLRLTFGKWIIWAFYDLTSFNFLSLFSWAFNIVSKLLFIVTLFLIGKYLINNK